jgi:hypothetical protein
MMTRHTPSHVRRLFGIVAIRPFNCTFSVRSFVNPPHLFFFTPFHSLLHSPSHVLFGLTFPFSPTFYHLPPSCLIPALAHPLPCLSSKPLLSIPFARLLAPRHAIAPSTRQDLSSAADLPYSAPLPLPQPAIPTAASSPSI